jgi:hypothetical protein
MALPYVKIDFKNGGIGGADPIEDGVTLMVLPDLDDSVEVDALTYDDFLSKNSNTDVAAVKAFYNEVNGKSRLIVSGAAASEANIKELLTKYNGDICLVAVPNVASEQTLTDLQNAGEWSAETLYAPVTFIVSLATDYPSLDSIDVKTFGKNRIAVVDNLADKNGVPLLYYVAGRAAKIPVQRSLARVKDGAAYPSELFSAASTPADNLHADTKAGKGFITARTYQGKAGYYFSDDPMAAPQTDDFALLPRRRVIDKAYRIAYKTLVEYIGDEIPVTSTGNIPASVCKDIENAVERQIELLMTNEGNLGPDPDSTTDKAVRCEVPADQNVVATSRLALTLLVKPCGYTKYIEVALGFSTAI